MLKTGLHANLKLETRIDPTLILRSELVELPILRLESRIQTELSLNPFLEINHEMDELQVKDEDNLDEERNEEEEEKVEEEIDWEEVVKDFSNYEDNYPMPYDKNDDELEFQQPVDKTLKDSLIDQLFISDLTEIEIIVAKIIIGNLDSDGYLACPIFDIIKEFENIKDIDKSKELKKTYEINDALFKEIQRTEFSNEKVEEILFKVQHLEPIGIASRDIQECLMIQIKNKKLFIEDAVIVLRDYYSEFANKKYERIMDLTGIDREQMQEVIAEITSLNPKPGVSRSLSHWEDADKIGERKNIITPDFYIREIEGELKLLLNDMSIPSLNINSKYSNLMLSGNTEKTTKEFVKKKLESARWFINAIQQRKMTLIKVMTSILKFQNDYFKYGPSKIKPLILKEVAEDIEMDIATVSRCTKDKYVDCDYGVKELKYFFSERLATASGTDVSTTIVKTLIDELIGNEDKKKPLSDQKISDILKDEGHTIARRTVQKYREQLGLPKARMRKDIF